MRQHRHAPSRPRGWAGFVRRYGWRAYAVPILAVVTVAAMVRGSGSLHEKRLADAVSPSVAAHRQASGPLHTAFEGLTGATAGFRAKGVAPHPVVVHLKSDQGTSCARNTYPQLVLVSISKQHLWVCQGPKQVNSSPVTTGKVIDNDQTPLGSWRVQAKQRDRYLVGPGYKDYVRYWLPFDGDFGLHDAPWQTMHFGGKDWRTHGSHGCVHTPTTVMAWIYRWARVGRTVVTIEG